MRFLATLSAVSAMALFAAVPAPAQGCCQHHHSCNGCANCGSSAPMGPGAGRCGNPAGETLEGNVTEVIYLPGPSAGASMVELRLIREAGPIVATRVQKGAKSLTLRDSFGRSNW
jgi:hypothetical protein